MVNSMSTRWAMAVVMAAAVGAQEPERHLGDAGCGLVVRAPSGAPTLQAITQTAQSLEFRAEVEAAFRKTRGDFELTQCRVFFDPTRGDPVTPAIRGGFDVVVSVYVEYRANSALTDSETTALLDVVAARMLLRVDAWLAAPDRERLEQQLAEVSQQQQQLRARAREIEGASAASSDGELAHAEALLAELITQRESVAIDVETEAAAQEFVQRLMSEATQAAFRGYEREQDLLRELNAANHAKQQLRDAGKPPSEWAEIDGRIRPLQQELHFERAAAERRTRQISDLEVQARSTSIALQRLRVRRDFLERRVAAHEERVRLQRELALQRERARRELQALDLELAAVSKRAIDMRAELQRLAPVTIERVR
jgi:hypothetical protein